MKRFLLPLVIICILFFSFFLYQQSLVQSSYNGLPTVPCIDTTMPIKHSYTFHVSITLSTKPYPLDTAIGHDYGKCLHDMFVKDTSGIVYVQTNGDEQFTLGNFFDEWHKTFTSKQIFGYPITQMHPCEIFVNGKQIYTYNQTPIVANEDIKIVYK